MTHRYPLHCGVVLVLLTWVWPHAARADYDMFRHPEQLEALRLDPVGHRGWKVEVDKVAPVGGVVYPEEPAVFDLRLWNMGTGDLVVMPTVEVVRLSTTFEGFDSKRGNIMIDGFRLRFQPAGTARRIPQNKMTIAARRHVSFSIRLGEDGHAAAFGVYAVIVDLGDRGRQAAATFARVKRPNSRGADGKGSALLFSHHGKFPFESQMATVARLGYRWVRTDGFPAWNDVASRADDAFDWSKPDRKMGVYRANGLWVLSNMYGTPRDAITPANWKAKNFVHDRKHDARWAAFVEACVERYTGPDGMGPLQIIDFWNEPWEGGGISAWKSDSARYRELYKTLYERAHAGSPHIRVGGCSSIMNTTDKFLSRRDWQETYRFDVLTDHYVHPHVCHGPRLAKHLGIFSIETETWMGSSPNMLVATASHFLAAGQRMVNPNHTTQLLWKNGKAGAMCTPTAAAASQFLHFTAGRRFERVVFHDHLPWLYQWSDGATSGFILAGDRSRLNIDAVTMYHQIRADGTIRIEDLDGQLNAYDVFGNPIPAEDGVLTLPFSMDSVYLEAPRLPADAVVAAVRAGEVRGVKPVEIVLDDFTTRVRKANALPVTLHNVLPAKIAGTVRVETGDGIRLMTNEKAVELRPGETKSVAFPIKSAEANQENAYRVKVSFASDAGPAAHEEVIHANVIARGTPTIDGDLSDWSRAVPVLVHATKSGRDLLEKAWQPYEADTETRKGLAEIRLLWDARHLYVAIRERNKDWASKPRLSTRNDDDYFGTGDTAQTYVKGIYEALPFSGHCLQIGLNAGINHDVPPLPVLTNVPRRMIARFDTDYEYAIWKAPDGVEVWRSLRPGMMRFNYLPRCMPEGYDGVPADARAVVTRDGHDTIYEIALPLADMPRWTPRAGATVGLTFALPGSGVKFGAGRSRTLSNGLTLLASWQSHPSNEIAWGLTK